MNQLISMFRSREEGQQHAAKLKAGLAALGDDFVAHICGWCNGEGSYEQTYTAGCGGGYYRSYGGCDWCKGAGLVIKGAHFPEAAAPESVVNQVVNAGVKRVNMDKAV